MNIEMNGKYNKVVLIDTENVHTECLSHLSVLDENDLLILMQSENSFKIALEHIGIIRSWKCKIKVVKIKNGTPNAMDFCLVAELAYRFPLMPKSEFYIISNDHGYRPAVSIWHSRGFNVKLFGSPECLKYPKITNYILQGELLNKILCEQRKNEENKVTLKDIVPKLVDDSDFSDEDTLEEYDNNIEDDIIYADDEVYEEEYTYEEDEYDKYNECDNEEITETEEAEETDVTLPDNISQCIDEINEVKKNRKQKMEEELSGLSLDELEESMMSDREYNAKKLREYVSEFSTTRENKLVSIILSNKEFADAEVQLQDVFKKNSDKYLPNIESNWNIFRHND